MCPPPTSAAAQLRARRRPRPAHLGAALRRLELVQQARKGGNHVSGEAGRCCWRQVRGCQQRRKQILLLLALLLLALLALLSLQLGRLGRRRRRGRLLLLLLLLLG